MKKRIDVVANAVHFTFDDGLEPLTFRVDDATAANQRYATIAGFSHRLGDAAAIPKDESNGFIVTERMRWDAVKTLKDHYESPTTEWNLRVAARGPARNMTWQAIADKRGVAYEIVAAEKAAADLAELEAM